MVGEHEHELEHDEIRRFTDIMVINTYATALGALAGWLALVLVVIALLQK